MNRLADIPCTDTHRHFYIQGVRMTRPSQTAAQVRRAKRIARRELIGDLTQWAVGLTILGANIAFWYLVVMALLKYLNS